MARGEEWWRHCPALLFCSLDEILISSVGGRVFPDHVLFPFCAVTRLGFRASERFSLKFVQVTRTEFRLSFGLLRLLESSGD